MNTESLEAWVDVALYDSSATARDRARQWISAQAQGADIDSLFCLLDAPSSVTRRRAVQILSEIPVRRVRPALVRTLKTQTSTIRAKRACGRILTILADGDEPALAAGLSDPNPRVRRACATAAAPESNLIEALLDEDTQVVENAAYSLIIREAMVSCVDLEHAVRIRSDVPESLIRLLARVSPESEMLAHLGSHGHDAALDHVKKAEQLKNLAADYPVLSAWGLSRIDALGSDFQRDEDYRIRCAAARSLDPNADTLSNLITDEHPAVRWYARQAQQGAYTNDRLDTRITPYPALDGPSSKPPYGLRADNPLPKVERVDAALAVCQARFNINLGVAMRSAEAAGLKDVIFVGRSDYVRSPARGADLALDVSTVPDVAALVRKAREEGYQIVAIQQTEASEPYHLAQYPPKPLFVVGSEDVGMPDDLKMAADLLVEIPQFGIIDSLNVATAATVVLFHWRVHLEHA